MSKISHTHRLYGHTHRLFGLHDSTAGFSVLVVGSSCDARLSFLICVYTRKPAIIRGAPIGNAMSIIVVASSSPVHTHTERL